MKILYSAIIALSVTSQMHAQNVGIGTTTPGGKRLTSRIGRAFRAVSARTLVPS